MDFLFDAAKDDELSLQQLGVLLRFCDHGPITVEASLYQDEDLQWLIHRGYLEQSLTHYQIKGLAGDAEAKEMWKAFCKAYPGVKAGCDSSLAKFKTIWKAGNKWRRILPELLPNLQRQIQEREEIAGVIKQCEFKGIKNHGLFIPPWKNLLTYIGKSEGWLESRGVPEALAKTLGASARPVEETPVVSEEPYSKYINWALAVAARHGIDEASAKGVLLLKADWDNIFECKEAPWKQFENYTTVDALRKSIVQWTIEYVEDKRLRSNYTLLSEYAAKKFREIINKIKAA